MKITKYWKALAGALSGFVVVTLSEFFPDLSMEFKMSIGTLIGLVLPMIAPSNK